MVKYPEPKKFKCLDCQTPICRRTLRCKKCFTNFRKTNIKRITKICFVCQNEYKTYPSLPNKKFCSTPCFIKYGCVAKGESHWNFKDGRSSNPNYRKIYKKNNRKRYNLKQIVREHTKRANGGSFTGEEWEDLKKKYNYMCLCCKKQEPEIKLSVDHIIPISKGGTSNIENIQPLCRVCNSQKHIFIINYIKKYNASTNI